MHSFSFRFVLDSRGSYGGNLIDPDVFANWDNIVQVMVNNTKPQACPICLSVPVSPKMTKCGHVYCYACILHYLHLGDKKWRKCPICYDSVYSKDLKSVGFTSSMLVEKPSLQHPTTLTMRLMKRVGVGLLYFEKKCAQKLIYHGIGLVINDCSS
jgi:hypothetical protein